MKIEKILLPVDGSEHSMNASRYAVDLAKQTEAEIVLIHCYSSFPTMMEGKVFDESISDELKAAANKVLGPYQELLKKSDVPFTNEIIEGPTAEAINTVAKNEKCDIIIMGSRGCSDIKGLLLGSVTHRVLQTAPCPVLVIR
jgi:nucleotide-binding universal stress UspA family protein